MGDRARSRNAFRLAEHALGYRNTGDWYQTPLRDLAGVLALAAEAGETELVDRLRHRLERDAPDADQLMTQEQVQLLLAANALLERAGPVNVTLNGQPMAERRIMADAQRLAAGLVFRNEARGPVWRTLSLTGAPRRSAAVDAGGLHDRQARLPHGWHGGRSQNRSAKAIALSSCSPASPKARATIRPCSSICCRRAWRSKRCSGRRMARAHELGRHVAQRAVLVDRRRSPTRKCRKRVTIATSRPPICAGSFRYAYIARAVSPGRYTMPAAQVEDMYRPGVMARTETGTILIAPRRRG